MEDLMNPRNFISHVEQNCVQRYRLLDKDKMLQIVDSDHKDVRFDGLLFGNTQEARLFVAILNANELERAGLELIRALRHHAEEFESSFTTHPYARAVKKIRERTKGTLAKVDEAALARSG